MFNNQALVDLFGSPWVKKLPAASLVASALAAIIHPVLAGIGFDASAAVSALARVGFQVAAELLPSLMEVSKKGIAALGDWLEKEIRGKPDVNEAAARTMVEQAQQVAGTVSQTHPEDRAEIADALSQGLASSGGATAEISELYRTAMKEATNLTKTIEEMKSRIDIWSSQTVEAKHGSMIENVEQNIEGTGGKQEIHADVNSIIKGVKQNIKR